MHFDTTFLLAEFGPPEDRKAQINSHRIKSINVTTKFENMSNTLFACFVNQMVGVFLKDVIVSILICPHRIDLMQSYKFKPVRSKKDFVIN